MNRHKLLIILTIRMLQCLCLNSQISGNSALWTLGRIRLAPVAIIYGMQRNFTLVVEHKQPQDQKLQTPFIRVKPNRSKNKKSKYLKPAIRRQCNLDNEQQLTMVRYVGGRQSKTPAKNQHTSAMPSNRDPFGVSLSFLLEGRAMSS